MGLFVYPPVSLSLNPGPVAFREDGANTVVSEDTVTPANSKPLPVKQLDSSGRSQEFNASGEALVHDQDVQDKLDTLNGKDFATQTTLAAVLAKIIAAPATEAKQDSVITSLGNLLMELDKKADLTETQPVSAASLPLPSGAATETTLASILAKIIAAPATEAKQDSIITELQALKSNSAAKSVLDTNYTASLTIPTASRVSTGLIVPTGKTGLEFELIANTGDSFTAYDALSGGNALGTFTQAGGRFPCNLPAGTEIYVQSNTGSDFTAQNFTANLIGA